MSEIINIEQRIQQVVNDREHGSRWLVHAAILLLRDLAQSSSLTRQEQMSLLYQSAYQIARARPAMAALASAMGRIIAEHEAGPGAIAVAAQELLDEYEQANAKIATFAQPLLQGQLLTCSVSGTVLDVLLSLRQQIERVIVLEGRPHYEGRTLARALSEQGIAVTLITDAQADIFLPQCQSVVVGADSILVNGDLLNKAGTALLAWAARARSIPFYVLCETLKISAQRWFEHDPLHLPDNLALLEEKEPAEVLAQPIPGVDVRNYYFDRTPHRLLTQVITEQGIVDRHRIRDIAVRTRAHERLLAKLQAN
ncbi:MAG: hypothetical protein NVS2B12_07460 [Ktedonobacteraceae bacterium]